MNKIVPALLILMTLYISGCATLAETASQFAQKPTAKLSDVSISSLSFNEANVLFSIDVENPNAFGLNVDAMRYNVDVQGNQFFSGTKDDKLRLDAGKTSTITVPVAFKFAELAKLFDSFEGINEFGYAIDSEIDINVPVLGVVTLPVSTSGALPIPKLPEISNPSINVTDLSLTKAKIALSFDMANPNTFGMLVDKLDYSLAVEGKQWVSTQSNQQINLTPESGKQNITVPLSLDLATIGLSGLRMLQSGKTPEISLDGTMNILPDIKGFSGGNVPFKLTQN